MLVCTNARNVSIDRNVQQAALVLRTLTLRSIKDQCGLRERETSNAQCSIHRDSLQLTLARIAYRAIPITLLLLTNCNRQAAPHRTAQST